MELDRVRRSMGYEYFVGFIGIGVAIGLTPDLRDVQWITFLFLLLLAAILESIMVPLGRAIGTFMFVIPFAAMVLYGPAVTVCLVTGAMLLSPVFHKSGMKVSTWLFNAGQYGLSAVAMVCVYNLFEVGFNRSIVNLQLVLGFLAAIATFLIVNHAFINVLYWVRKTFTVKDMVQMFLNDGAIATAAIPLALLVIAISPNQPLLGPVLILPVVLLAQFLRLYQKNVALQRVHRATSQLTSEFDVDRICEVVARATSKLTYADAVCIFVHDAANKKIIPNMIYPIEASSNFRVDGHTEAEGGVIWNVMRSTKWEYVPDTRRDTRVRYDGNGKFYRSLAVFPMHAHGEAKGAIVCYSLHPHAFGQETLEYIQTMAMQVSVLLHNAELYRTLQEQSWKDGATGLYNYRFFYEALERKVNEARNRNAMLSVAVVDIDYFKKFNDTYGHLAGDAVLAGVGKLLSELAGPDALVARYGGEEFGVIFPYGPDETFAKLEQMRTGVSRYTVEHEGYRLQNITISSGIATFPLHAVNDRDLLLKADSAMYWGAKQRGRNRTALYSPEFENQLFVDELTGLYTHHFMNIRVREEFDRGVNRWGVLCFDLENFSYVNGMFGFEVGDKVLRETSLLIKECLRHNELACRFGGDEFLVVLPDVVEDDLEQIGRRIVQAISTHRFECGTSIVLTQRTQMVSKRIENLVDPTDLFDQISTVFAQMHQSVGESLA